jgi:hypothetical protein
MDEPFVDPDHVFPSEDQSKEFELPPPGVPPATNIFPSVATASAG